MAVYTIIKNKNKSKIKFIILDVEAGSFDREELF